MNENVFLDGLNGFVENEIRRPDDVYSGAIEIAPLAVSVCPIYFVIDTSDSMVNRMGILNKAMEESLARLAYWQNEEPDPVLKVAVLAFSSGCRWVTPELVPVEDMVWADLTAGGVTDLGAALDALEAKMKNREPLGENAGKLPPVVVFAIDGEPSGLVELQMEQLWATPAYKNATKVAISMGDLGKADFLTKLVGSQEGIFVASDDRDIPNAVYEGITYVLYHYGVSATMGAIRDPDDGVVGAPLEPPVICPTVVDNDYGRAKCKLLKSIRKAIADANHIPYEITECHSQGHCNGACSVCDKEAEEFSKLLTRRAAAGQTIVMPATDTSLLDEFLPKKSSDDPFPPEDNTVGGWMASW